MGATVGQTRRGTERTMMCSLDRKGLHRARPPTTWQALVRATSYRRAGSDHTKRCMSDADKPSSLEHTHTYTHAHTHIRTHTHIHTIAHARTHTYTHAHTHTHTRTWTDRWGRKGDAEKVVCAIHTGALRKAWKAQSNAQSISATQTRRCTIALPPQLYATQAQAEGLTRREPSAVWAMTNSIGSSDCSFTPRPTSEPQQQSNQVSLSV